MPLTGIIVCSPVKNNSHLAESTDAVRRKRRWVPAKDQSKSPSTGYLGTIWLLGNLLMSLFSAVFNVMGGASFSFSLTASTSPTWIYYRQGSRNNSLPLELTNIKKALAWWRSNPWVTRGTLRGFWKQCIALLIVCCRSSGTCKEWPACSSASLALLIIMALVKNGILSAKTKSHGKETIPVIHRTGALWTAKCKLLQGYLLASALIYRALSWGKERIQVRQVFYSLAFLISLWKRQTLVK